MQVIKTFGLLVCLSGALIAQPTFGAQNDDAENPGLGDPGTAESYHRGRITDIISEERIAPGNTTRQMVRVESLDDSLTEPQELEFFAPSDRQKLSAGDTIVLLHVSSERGNSFWIVERYRLSGLIGIALLFAICAVIFAQWRGVMALVGLGISIFVLIQFLIPQLLAGKNPILMSLLAAFMIATSSLFLAHGFSRRTVIAWISTLVTVIVSLVLSILFVRSAHLFGFGSEEALYLQIPGIENLNLQGLLLGGIMIGALGVLDDITTSQTAAVGEIHRANPTLPFQELITRGFIIGREHITSLINTLALAYAGASLPLLLLFSIYERPVWVLLNSEAIAEEIVRTFVGSLALMLAVPITTFLAAYYLPKSISSPSVDKIHRH